MEGEAEGQGRDFFLAYAFFYGLTEPAEQTMAANLRGTEWKGLVQLRHWHHRGQKHPCKPLAQEKRPGLIPGPSAPENDAGYSRNPTTGLSVTQRP